MPDRDFGFQGETCKYPPLFLYALYPFSAIGGAVAAAIPILVADAGTAVLVYLIVLKVAAKKIALAASLLYSFASSVLYYGGCLLSFSWRIGSS